MRFIEIISKLENIDEFSMIFVKSNNGKITRESDALILELTESEMDIDPSEMSEEKCPGYEYFMEAYLVKEFMSDNSKEYPTLEKNVTD